MLRPGKHRRQFSCHARVKHVQDTADRAACVSFTLLKKIIIEHGRDTVDTRLVKKKKKKGTNKPISASFRLFHLLQPACTLGNFQIWNSGTKWFVRENNREEDEEEESTNSSLGPLGGWTCGSHLCLWNFQRDKVEFLWDLKMKKSFGMWYKEWKHVDSWWEWSFLEVSWL